MDSCLSIPDYKEFERLLDEVESKRGAKTRAPLKDPLAKGTPMHELLIPNVNFGGFCLLDRARVHLPERFQQLPFVRSVEHETKGGDSNGGAGRESDESDEEEVNESSEGGEEDSASSESSSESAEDTDVDEEAVTLNVPRRTASWPVVNGSIVNGIVNGSIVNGSTVNGSTRLQPSPQQQTIQPETVDTNQASKRPEPGRCRYGDDCYRQNCHYWHPWQELEYERFMAAWRQLARCRFGNNCCSAECTYWHPRQDDAFLKFVTHCLASFMTAPLAPLSSRPAHSAKSCPITLKDTAFESNKTTETKRVRQAWASPSFHNKCHSSSVSHRR